MLYVDQRWVGKHGIGRFSYEVSSRLRFPYESLTTKGSPVSPFDVISPARLRLRSDDSVYSPGYNAGVTRATQYLTLHDLIHLEGGGARSLLLRAYYERVVRPTVERAGSVFTVSETSARVIQDWLGNSSVRVVNVGNGCSDIFTPAEVNQLKTREYFLYVGNLKSHKNFGVLLRALQVRPEYSLVAIINDAEAAESTIYEAGVSAQVNVVSGVSDAELADYYRGSLGLLMPSTSEGFGLPAVESLSCGRPVVYSKSCLSVAEIVGEHGVAVDRELDAEGWAEAMDGLLEVQESFNPPSKSWRDQYRWSAVAANVSDHLTSTLSAV